MITMIKNYKKFIPILVFVLLILALPVKSYAQTNEATQSASFESIKQIIKNNIENSKVQGAIDNLLNRKSAIVGEVIRVTDETITISGRLGTRIIPIDGTLSITKDKKPIKITDIAVENWVTILGKIKDDDFTPVFIFVSNKTLQPKPQYVNIGTVTDISKNSITIKPRSGESEKTINIVKATNFDDINGSQINISDITKDITVLIAGYETDTSIEASTIRSLAPVTKN